MMTMPSSFYVGSAGASQTQETVTRWVACSAFRREQERLQIPNDPEKWDRSQVRHWAEWAVKEFPESSFDPRSNDWDIEGSQLVELSHEDFKSKVLFQLKQIQLIDSLSCLLLVKTLHTTVLKCLHYFD